MQWKACRGEREWGEILAPSIARGDHDAKRDRIQYAVAYTL
jgi:hypothetical protein